MRWIVKESGVPKKVKGRKSKPKIGDIRVMLKFAFFPKKIGEYVYWLEFYKEGYQYETYKKTTPNPVLSLRSSHNELFFPSEPRYIQITETGWRLKKTLPLKKFS